MADAGQAETGRAGCAVGYGPERWYALTVPGRAVVRSWRVVSGPRDGRRAVRKVGRPEFAARDILGGVEGVRAEVPCRIERRRPGARAPRRLAVPVAVPLIEGIVFVAFAGPRAGAGGEVWDRVLGPLKRLGAGVISAAGVPLRLAAWEVRRLMEAEASLAAVDDGPAAWEPAPGDSVWVTVGTERRLETVLAVDRRRRCLVVAVPFLGAARSAEVAMGAVVPAGGSADGPACRALGVACASGRFSGGERWARHCPPNQ